MKLPLLSIPVLSMILSLLAASLSASILATQNFETLALGVINTQSATDTGLSGTWSANGADASYTVADTNPLKPGYGRYLNASATGTYSPAMVGFDTAVTFNAFSTNPTDVNTAEVTSGIFWVRFLYRPESNMDSSGLFGVDDSRFPNTSGRTSGAFVSIGSTGIISLAGYDGSNALIEQDTGVAANGTTHLIYMKLDLDANTSSLWVDEPEGLNLGTADATLSHSGTNGLQFRSLRLYRGPYAVDDFAMGTTFADIAVVPEPSMFAGIFGLVTLLVVIRLRRK